ncbi:hypothetical protein [Rhodocyclus tenuis]|uniref:Uncharacterized protein n=1 Tax=Rhodocyclus tenuis TaxID=1066 RepID=A0A840G0N1_RHOTE|nr:hypothetical protein [Rhodocyclus tenuis]MBB4247957.1 hypothetical protein [Rhodocyclus tenuis]
MTTASLSARARESLAYYCFARLLVEAAPADPVADPDGVGEAAVVAAHIFVSLIGEQWQNVRSPEGRDAQGLRELGLEIARLARLLVIADEEEQLDGRAAIEFVLQRFSPTHDPRYRSILASLPCNLA